MACRNTGRARSGWSWRRSVSSAVTGSTIRITVDSLERVDDELLTDRAGLEQERVTRAQFRRKAVAAAMAWLTNSRQAAGSRRSARAWAATSSASSAPDATSLSDTNRSIE